MRVRVDLFTCKKDISRINYAPPSPPSDEDDTVPDRTTSFDSIGVQYRAGISDDTYKAATDVAKPADYWDSTTINQSLQIWW